LELGEYRYYDYKNKCIDFEGMCEDLEKMEDQPIVLFHACAHNPTGTDLTHEQWEKVLKIVIKKGILPFFDMAYQGFASGDLDEDAFSVRLFAKCWSKYDFGSLLRQKYGIIWRKSWLFKCFDSK